MILIRINPFGLRILTMKFVPRPFLCRTYLGLVLFLGGLVLPLLSYAQNFTEADRLRMRRETESLLENYVFGLNQIGDASDRAKRWRDDDINNILTNYFESTEVPVYNDVERENLNNESFSALQYLQTIGRLYEQGVNFQYRLNLKNPCFEIVGDETFYFVKVEVSKLLTGILLTDNAMNTNLDSIDIYVKYPILQNRPELVTAPGKIYQITAHRETTCEEVARDTKLSLTSFEDNILRERAENFVKDYAITLNIIGNPLINERFNTEDYFENANVKVYNDLLPIILLDEFPADDYLNNIELWYQEGIIFDYRSVKASNVLTQDDYVSVEIEVERVIRVPARNYRDRQNLRIFVKFPIDAKGEVGAERLTPRIYKIERKEKRIRPKNYLAAGGQFNAFNYFGDLNPLNQRFRPTYRLIRPGFGIHMSKKFSPRLFTRFSYVSGQVVGDDFTAADPNDELARYRYIRNLHFRNYIHELSLVGMYDILPNTGLYYKRRFIRPYVFGGIGVIYHSPQAKTPSEFGAAWVSLKNLNTEGQGLEGGPDPYSNIQVQIPFGLGFRFKLTYRMDFSVELGLRYLLFDYLDDVSGSYVDPDLLESDLARRMYNRALEATSAFSGESRQQDLDRLLADLNGLLSFQGVNGNIYQTFNGYGREGEQRGNPNSNDFYLVSGFHLTYLINVGSSRSLKQRPRFLIDFD